MSNKGEMNSRDKNLQTNGERCGYRGLRLTWRWGGPELCLEGHPHVDKWRGARGRAEGISSSEALPSGTWQRKGWTSREGSSRTWLQTGGVLRVELACAK